MKIGIFTDTYEPYVSGVTTSIKMLKNALENMGHTVYIVTANLTGFHFKYDEKNKIIYLPGIKTGIYDSRLTGVYSFKAFKIIKSWHLDVIHSQTEFGVGAFSRIVAKKLNIPIVHTYHTLYEDYVYYVTHGHFDNLGKKLAIKITKYYCEKKCDELIVPTDKIKDLFINKYHITKKINVIPTGIDTKKFELTPEIAKKVQKLKKEYKIKDTDFLIGSVGRIAKEKSFDEEIKTIKKLIDENKNIILMIIGDGPELHNLKNLTQDLNIEKNVIFTGKVKYDLIPAYYHLFNIMVSFSKTETQGLTIIEGLAASLPVICLKDEAFEAIVTHNYNGYLFRNAKEFIELTTKLITNPKIYDTMCLNAKNSIYRYSKEVFASDILKVYAEALEK